MMVELSQKAKPLESAVPQPSQAATGGRWSPSQMEEMSGGSVSQSPAPLQVSRPISQPAPRSYDELRNLDTDQDYITHEERRIIDEEDRRRRREQLAWQMEYGQ